MLKSTFKIVFSLFVSGQLMAQSEIRKYSNEFLTIPPSARGAAMGGAQTATTSDVYSGMYNPAGLAHIDNSLQVGFTHAEWFAGISKFDVINFAMPFDDKKRTAGFTFVRFGVDNIPNTLFLIGNDGSVNYDNITSFSSADYAFMLHYAQKFVLKKGEYDRGVLSFGVSPKFIYRHVGKFGQAYGFGADVGVQYRYKGLHAGLMLKDITTTFNSWSFNFTPEERQVLLATNNDLPKNSSEITAPMISLGIAYEIAIKKKFFITPEVNFMFNTDGRRNVLVSGKPIGMDMVFGLEMNYAKIGYLRVGANNIQQYYKDNGKKAFTLSPSVGAGVHIKVIDIGYAFTNLLAVGSSSNSVGKYSNVITLRLDLNLKSKPKSKPVKTTVKKK